MLDTQNIKSFSVKIKLIVFVDSVWMWVNAYVAECCEVGFFFWFI